MTWMDESAWSGRLWLGGEWVKGGGGDQPVVEPATGSELGRVGRAAPGDVERAVERSRAAQRAWAAAPYTERAAVLRRAGDLWARHADEIGGWIIRESGGIPPKAGLETQTAAEECHEAAALASQPFGEVLRSAQPRLSFSRRVPVGTVGVIAPFNFPLILSIRSVAPALALGNAVVLKPDPRTAVCGGVTLARVFEEAGLPAGLLSVLPGDAAVGEALVVHPAVRVIAFTGSTRAGRAVGALAGQYLKRAHLELGGNSALVVMGDVDPERAASVGAFASFMHQGQICMTTGRHLVHERIADEFVGRLAEHADALPVGDPATEQVALGPVIDSGQRDNVHALVTASVDSGARLAAGGTYEGLFYQPTVLTDVTPQTPAWAQEVFGPLAPVMRFSDPEEAVELAAESYYGLVLGILTENPLRGLELADRIPTGILHINDQTANDEAVAPFGGVRDSGTGARFGGPAANIEAFTETQWVTLRSEIPAFPF